MNITSQEVHKIVQAKPRSYLLIENLTDSTLYISKEEHPEVGLYTSNGVVIKLNGVLEINPCMYQGSVYAVCDVDSDIRVLEL